MALDAGTNCGFCATAPTADPGTLTELLIDDRIIASKFTTPVGCTNITEIGFYVKSTLHSGVGWKAAIYTHNSGGDAPDALVGSIATGNSLTASTAGWYKYTGLSISVSAETVYWIVIEVADSVNDVVSWYDPTESGRYGYGTPLPLSDPFPGWSAADVVSCAFYAKYGSSSSPKVCMIL